MQTTQENFKPEIRWHVVSVNSRMEIETANRINESGFVAHCPVYEKKYFDRTRAHQVTRVSKFPLFVSYIFVKRDDGFDEDFRIEEFETTKVSLFVFRKCLLAQGHMDLFDEIADAMTAVGGDLEKYRLSKLPKPEIRAIVKGDVMQVLYGAMAGKTVMALRSPRGELVDVEPEEYPGRSVKVKVDSLARAV